MEKRAFLAVALMAAVLILYQTFLGPAPQEAPPASQQQQTAEKPTAPPAAPAPASKPIEMPSAIPPAVAAEPRPPQRLAKVSAPLYDAVVSSEGGKFQEFTLKYRGEKPMVILGDLGPAGLVIGPADGSTASPVPMQLSTETLTVVPDKPAPELVLTGTYEGLRVREAVTFRADTFAVDAHVRLENPSGTPRAVRVALPWFTRQDWRDEKLKERFQGQHPTQIVWSGNGHVTHDDNLCNITPLSGDGQWVGMGSVWYMSALVPQSVGFTLVAYGDDKACESKAKEPVGRATIAVQASP